MTLNEQLLKAELELQALGHEGMRLVVRAESSYGEIAWYGSFGPHSTRHSRPSLEDVLARLKEVVSNAS